MANVCSAVMVATNMSMADERRGSSYVLVTVLPPVCTVDGMISQQKIDSWSLCFVWNMLHQQWKNRPRDLHMGKSVLVSNTTTN